MVDNEALVPAVEVLMIPDLHLKFLQQCLICPLAHRMHRGTHVIQDAHDPRRVLVGPRRQSPSSVAALKYTMLIQSSERKQQPGLKLSP